MLVQTADFVKGNFAPLADFFLHWAAQDNLFETLCKRLQAATTTERNAMCAALGHVCEQVVQTHATGCFHTALRTLLLMDKPTNMFWVPKPPRALEWEIVLYDSQPHICYDYQYTNLSKGFGVAEFPDADAVSVETWLLTYAETVNMLLQCPIPLTSLPDFFKTVWPCVFDDPSLRVVLTVDSHTVNLVEDTQSILHKHYIAVSSIVICDPKLMQQPPNLKDELIYKLHTVGDVLACAHFFPNETTCIFNGTSLVKRDADGILCIKENMLESLGHVVTQSNLCVGIFVNQGTTPSDVIKTLVDLVNYHKDIFRRGFCYGNVNGPGLYTMTSNTTGVGLGLHKLAGRSDSGSYSLS